MPVSEQLPERLWAFTTPQGGIGVGPSEPAGLRYSERCQMQEYVPATEVERLRGLAQQVLDALDAEKTPDFGVGHDRAHAAALAMLGQRQTPIEGESLTLDEVRRRYAR